MGDEVKLRECPFCGSDLVRSEFHSTRTVERREHDPDVSCILSGVIISMDDREDDIERRAAWNTRVPAPDLVEALQELNDALDDGLCNSGTPGFDSGRLGRAQDAARAALSKAGIAK